MNQVIIGFLFFLFVFFSLYACRLHLASRPWHLVGVNKLLQSWDSVLIRIVSSLPRLAFVDFHVTLLFLCIVCSGFFCLFVCFLVLIFLFCFLHIIFHCVTAEYSICFFTQYYLMLLHFKSNSCSLFSLSLMEMLMSQWLTQFTNCKSTCERWMCYNFLCIFSCTCSGMQHLSPEKKKSLFQATNWHQD